MQERENGGLVMLKERMNEWKVMGERREMDLIGRLACERWI